MVLSQLRNRRGSWTLIGLLAATAIVAVVMAVVVFGRLGPEGRTRQEAVNEGLVQPKEGQTVLGAAVDKSKQTACMTNLRQIRQMIEYQKAESGQPPATLQDLRLGSAGNCPQTGQPYQYDPTTGSVRCATPGHEGL